MTASFSPRDVASAPKNASVTRSKHFLFLITTTSFLWRLSQADVVISKEDQGCENNRAPICKSAVDFYANGPVKYRKIKYIL